MYDLLPKVHTTNGSIVNEKANHLKVKSTLKVEKKEYLDIYKAIESDDIVNFINISAGMLKERDKEILHSKLILDENEMDKNLFQKFSENLFQPSRAFTLATLFGSVNIMKHMFKEEVDILATDWKGNNVIQCMIIFAFLHPTKEQKMCEIYKFITCAVDRKLVHSLLM